MTFTGSVSITQTKPGWGSNGEERSKRDGKLITGFKAPRTKPSFADGQEVSGVRIANTCTCSSVKIGFASSDDNRRVPQPIHTFPAGGAVSVRQTD